MRMRPPLMPLSRAVLNVSPISTVARPCGNTPIHINKETMLPAPADHAAACSCRPRGQQRQFCDDRACSGHEAPHILFGM